MNLNQEKALRERLEPSLSSAGWSWDSEVSVEENKITDRDDILARSRRATIADYLLRFHQMPIAVLEVADNPARLPEALRQAEYFARKLCLHFAIATDGMQFCVRHLLGSQNEHRGTLPTPENLLSCRQLRIDWSKWASAFEAPWFTDSNQHILGVPRLFHQVAVFEALACFASSKTHALMVMPPGSGKGQVFRQICWKLLQSGLLRNNRILVITNRTVLRDQFMSLVAGFAEYQALHLDRESVKSHSYRSATFLFSNYQTLNAGGTSNKLYAQIPPEDVDLVVCLDLHSPLPRTWGAPLEHFAAAFQLALLSSIASEKPTEKRLRDYFTSQTDSQPVFDYASQRPTVLNGILEELPNQPFTTAEALEVTAACILVKLAQDENPDLFPVESHWEKLLMQSRENLASFLCDRILPAILHSPDPRLSVYRIAPSIFFSLRTKPSLLSLVVSRLARVDLSLPKNRLRAAQELEEWVDNIGQHSPTKSIGDTPTALAEWIADVMLPKPTESIYDPNVGTGRLLGAMLSRSHLGISSPPKANPLTQIAGAEPNSLSHLVALARLALIGGAVINLKLGNPLVEDAAEFNTSIFDIVVTNPPFGARLDSDSVRHRLPIPTRTSQGAYLLNALRRLGPGGRAAIVVPESLLFNEAERDLRRHLLDNFRLETVIALPELLFGKQSAVNASLLIVCNSGPSQSVLFVSREFSRLAFDPAPDGKELGQLLTLGLRHVLRVEESFSGFQRVFANLMARIKQLAHPDAQATQSKTATAALQHAIELVVAMPEIEIRIDAPVSEQSPPSVLATEVLRDFLKRAPGQRSVWRTPRLDLAEREDQLTAQHSGDEAIRELVQSFQSNPNTIPVRQLGEVAEVYSGLRLMAGRVFHYRDVAPTSEYFDVLAARDLQPTIRGATSSRWVGSDVSANVSEKHQLRTNDLLLASLGKIGSVAIYKDDFVRYAHTDVLIVRLSDPSISPEYLWRLLQTEPYQQWLKGHAAGAIYQRLSAGILSKLLVPIPPAEQQQQLAESFKGRESWHTLKEALTTLQPVTRAFSFLTDEACSIDLAALPEDKRNAESALPLLQEVFSKWKKSCQVPNKMIAQESPLDILNTWALERLNDLADISATLSMADGPDRFIALQSWDSKRAHEESAPIGVEEGVLEGLGRFQSSAPMVVKALSTRLDAGEKIIRRLRDVAKAECKRMLDTGTKLSASISPSIVPLNTTTPLTITISNDGLFGLRGFVARLTDIQHGGCHAPLFCAGEKLHWTLTLSPERIGRIPLTVRWMALRTDDQSCHQNVELAIEVQEEIAGQLGRTLSITPYILGTYITEDRQDMFYGRTDVVDEVRRSLRFDGPSTVLILGANRKLGKSSLLIHLQQPEVLPGWLPVYIDLQAGESDAHREGIPTGKLFYLIAFNLIEAVWKTGLKCALPDCGPGPGFKGTKPNGLELLDFHAFLEKKLLPLFGGENPYARFRLVVEAILASLGDRHVLLMLDEFDKLQGGIDSGATSLQFPDNLRNLLHSYPRLSAIISGSHRLHQLSSQYFNALYCLGKRLEFSALDKDATLRLITQPVEGHLIYAQPALDFILNETVCLPYLVQGLCDKIFSHCAKSGDRLVTLPVAEASANEFASSNDYFSQLWHEDIGTDLRHLLVCLVQRAAGGSDPISAAFLMDQLEKSGIGRIDFVALGRALDELVGLRALAKGGDASLTTYRINIPLLARWMRQNQIDFDRYRLAATIESEKI